MQRDLFKENLITAAQHAIPFTQEYVIEPLPNNYQFLRLDKEETDRLKKKHPAQPCIRAYQGPLTADQVVDYYWSDDKHPEWLELDVVSIDGDNCNILVTSRGQWMNDDERMMALAKIKNNEHPPFSHGVDLPPFHASEKKFSIHWRQHYRLSFWTRLKNYIIGSPLYARYWKWRYGKMYKFK